MNSLEAEAWSEAGDEADGREAFVIDIEGFEGPLDLLLALAKAEKVDLSRISVLALAEQYLAFIAELRHRRLAVAADYLVMAAWLAYLKSRLLLPDPPAGDEPTGEELAAALADRLRRLEAIRKGAAWLSGRSWLGRDVFARGAPEPVVTTVTGGVSATLYDLLSAYTASLRRHAPPHVAMARRQVWSLADAREVLVRLVGKVAEWTPLELFLAPFAVDPSRRRSLLASTFGAGLELVREGKMAMSQTEPFAPIFLKDASPSGDATEARNG
ncbi:MAG: ScpA family protein [Bauldia sp.]